MAREKKIRRTHASIITTHWRGKKFNWLRFKPYPRGHSRYFSHADDFGYYRHKECM